MSADFISESVGTGKLQPSTVETYLQPSLDGFRTLNNVAGAVVRTGNAMNITKKHPGCRGCLDT